MCALTSYGWQRSADTLKQNSQRHERGEIAELGASMPRKCHSPEPEHAQGVSSSMIESREGHEKTLLPTPARSSNSLTPVPNGHAHGDAMRTNRPTSESQDDVAVSSSTGIQYTKTVVPSPVQDHAPVKTRRQKYRRLLESEDALAYVPEGNDASRVTRPRNACGRSVNMAAFHQLPLQTGEKATNQCRRTQRQTVKGQILGSALVPARFQQSPPKAKVKARR